jgi:hypothetical protein
LAITGGIFLLLLVLLLIPQPVHVHPSAAAPEAGVKEDGDAAECHVRVQKVLIFNVLFFFFKND